MLSYLASRVQFLMLFIHYSSVPFSSFVLCGCVPYLTLSGKLQSYSNPVITFLYLANKQQSASPCVCMLVYVHVCARLCVCTTFNLSLTSTDFNKAETDVSARPLNMLTVLFSDSQHLYEVLFVIKRSINRSMSRCVFCFCSFD